MESLQDSTNLSLGHTDVTPGGVTATPNSEPVVQDKFVSHACTRITPVLNRVGDKWSMQIVMALGYGPRRFSELKREIDGISQRMLTLSLRGLERDGLISRHVTPTIPPRVDYELTELGTSLRGPVRALGAWAAEHIECIRAAQERFDASSQMDD